MEFPFKRGDQIQHVSNTGPVFVVQLVDCEVSEAYAEPVYPATGAGVRVINPANWKKVEAK